jgi:hypothetical protein
MFSYLANTVILFRNPDPFLFVSLLGIFLIVKASLRLTLIVSHLIGRSFLFHTP